MGDTGEQSDATTRRDRGRMFGNYVSADTTPVGIDKPPLSRPLLGSDRERERFSFHCVMLRRIVAGNFGTPSRRQGTLLREYLSRELAT